jgi:hypothetical protein
MRTNIYKKLAAYVFRAEKKDVCGKFLRSVGTHALHYPRP